MHAYVSQDISNQGSDLQADYFLIQLQARGLVRGITSMGHHQEALLIGPKAWEKARLIEGPSRDIA